MESLPGAVLHAEGEHFRSFLGHIYTRTGQFWLAGGENFVGVPAGIDDMFEVVLVFFFECQRHGIRHAGIHSFLTHPGLYGHETADPFVAGVITIEGELVADPQTIQHSHRHADRQPEYVDKRRDAISGEISPGRFAVAGEHGMVLAQKTARTAECCMDFIPYGI